MTSLRRHIGRTITRLALLALATLALFPPGPSAPAARAQGLNFDVQQFNPKESVRIQL
jgi:hypothetical protein